MYTVNAENCLKFFVQKLRYYSLTFIVDRSVPHPHNSKPEAKFLKSSVCEVAMAEAAPASRWESKILCR